ncbi:SgcJ/EcaC family oxidoreductase [Micromonospora sp. NBC_01699]|uniref:YybH family protein n=1 Tax=Micromonospora sp. NBC_01699 TaxID=2975984 RepID=UPI002E27CBD3|nr:SgcJ/EcaC family oxidoreductase [Micromonospora sp. NBC_01699]
MSTNEEQIRALIGRWAEAVHGGDLDGVLADHAKDVVMFDVPPPYEGVRGLDAYRETWPPFFEWQRTGASFEIESLEVTAGDDVAFAYALARCGTEQDLAANPASRLRLTFGLRRENGCWLIAHEHHSFPLADPEDNNPDAEREVRELHERWFADTAANDLDSMMAVIADDVVSYEHEEPLRYVGVDAVRELCQRNLDAAPGETAVSWTVPDLKILVRGDLAVAWGLNHVRIEPPDAPAIDSWSRGTRVFERRNGTWLLTHQHLSVPYSPTTGAARTDLQP